MNVKYINAFIEGAVDVIKIMAFIDSTPGRPYLKTDLVARGDFSGLITFSGSVTGSLALSFSEPCLLKIVANMLGNDKETAAGMLQNAAGELTNMISGDARKRLQSQGLIIYADIPKVLSGKNHVIKHILGGPSIIVPFETDFGAFVVDVNIKDLK